MKYKPYRTTLDKYYVIYKPYHKYSYKSGYVPEHRYIYHIYLSIKYNRIIYLPKKYDIHHKNKNTYDNRIENLELLSRKNHRIEDSNHILHRVCNLCNRNYIRITNKGYRQCYSDIDGFLCLRCYQMIRYYQKRFGIL